jgi:hypothetical protein
MEKLFYYNKYIKYKNKYFNHVKQYGGNYKSNENIFDTNRCILSPDGIFINLEDCEQNNVWKDSYIELYNILLSVVSGEKNLSVGEIQRIKSLCVLLFQNLSPSYLKLEKIEQRGVNYNMRFIINVVSMLINEPFASSIPGKIEYNKMLALDAEQFYYLEDSFTEDLDLFYSEYDNLVSSKKSKFFFRSNLVNISILLKCYSDRCIEKIVLTGDGFYENLYRQFTPADFERIFGNFSTKKYEMLKLLLIAYLDFSYEKVKDLYIEYLDFYNENFNHLELVNTEEGKLEESYQRLKEIITTSGTTFFVYLSCNLSSEFKFQKFEATRILISYLGFRKNNDTFYNSIDILEHDICNPHMQYERKIAYSEEKLSELRRFYKLLNTSFISNREILEKIVIFIHNNNYENGYSVILDKSNSENILNQTVKKLIFGLTNIKDLIEEYLTKYKTANPANVIELINDPLLFYRLYSNNIHIKRRAVTILNEEEKKLLIKCLTEVAEPDIMVAIAKFINNTDYTIDLTIALDPDVISLLKRIIRRDADTYDYIFEFVKFLYLNYFDLFSNDIIYKNILTIQE